MIHGAAAIEKKIEKKQILLPIKNMDQSKIRTHVHMHLTPKVHLCIKFQIPMTNDLAVFDIKQILLPN